MTKIDFADLKIAKQYRNKQNPFYYQDLIAYDTETFLGRAVLICDSKGNHCYPESPEQALSFLTRKKFRSTLGWFFNINHDVESILKWLIQETISELAKFGEIVTYANIVDRIKIKLIDRKMLILSRSQHAFYFYDIANFFKGKLDTVAKKYLGMEKKDPGIDFEKLAGTDELWEWLHTDQAIEYCCHDAFITEKLAQIFIDTCNGFGLYTRNFCSTASIAKHYFLSKCEVPVLNQITKGKKLPVKLAYEAYKGGFIQTFKKGYFEKVWLYDIKSAYPFEMTRLPDLSKGKLKFAVKQIPIDAYMGWMRVKIHTSNNGAYDYSYFNPVGTYIKKFNKNYYFGGTFYATITLAEYEALKNDFDIEFNEGYFWFPKELIFTYDQEIRNIYRLKEQNRHDKNLYDLLKYILNGYYGLFIQKIKKRDLTEYEAVTGNLFNPFLASYITAGCRLQVYDLIKKHGAQNLIAVMTDGVAFSNEIPIENSNQLGEWSLDMQGEGVFIGSGLYTIKPENEKPKTATRGFKMTDKIDFFKLLAQNLDNLKINLPQKIRLTYKEALRVKRFDDWNIIKWDPKDININCDTKRIWAREFSNCRDVLENIIDSAPIFVQQD